MTQFGPRGEDKGVTVPSWMLYLGAPTVFLVSVGIMVGVARADVDNLKKEVSELKPLSAAVATLQDNVNQIRNSQTEMRQDIKTLLMRGTRDAGAPNR